MVVEVWDSLAGFVVGDFLGIGFWVYGHMWGL